MFGFRRWGRFGGWAAATALAAALAACSGEPSPPEVGRVTDEAVAVDGTPSFRNLGKRADSAV